MPYNSTKEYLKGYRTYLRAERSMSLNTYKSYCSDVQEMLSALGGQSGQDADPRLVTRDDILSYLETRTSADDAISKRTLARILSSLRSFFGWL